MYIVQIVIINLSQVDKAAIERYRGKKEPPHIRMLIKAASDKTTPPDIIVEAMLQGVLEPNIIKFEQEAVNVVECVCQVFYHKKALNQWRARVAFFPKQYLEVQIKTSIVFNDIVCILSYCLPKPEGSILILCSPFRWLIDMLMKKTWSFSVNITIVLGCTKYFIAY